MSYLRFSLDLAVKEPIPDALKDKLPAIRDHIRQLKAFASKINAGGDNEEMTVRAVYHKCFHDESPLKPCGPEMEV